MIRNLKLTVFRKFNIHAIIGKIRIFENGFQSIVTTIILSRGCL